MKHQCWDGGNVRWLTEGQDECEFNFCNGKWRVIYETEIHISGYEGSREMDVPVVREVEDPVVIEIN